MLRLFVMWYVSYQSVARLTLTNTITNCLDTFHFDLPTQHTLPHFSTLNLHRYPEYEVFGDEGVAQSALSHSRYSLNSLFGVAFDVYTLADSEYVVCTFSSNVSFPIQRINL